MRKSTAKKRILLPDPIYNDILVTRFLNSLMYDDKKNTASKIFHECLEIVTKRTNEDDLEVFKKLAKEKYGIINKPIENEYGRGSLHYEYSVKKSEKYSEYYHLVAEPKKLIV